MNEISRYQGCLLGLAVGDALGTTLEFKRYGTFDPITDMIGGGAFGLEPGQWTDDTSMALCLAESLISTKGFDPIDQIERYCDWFEYGHFSSKGYCFDIGGTTARALRYYLETGRIIRDSDGAGNGSLMRLAPVPMFYANDYYMAIQLSGKSSTVTHGAFEAIDSCGYYGGLIAAALHGVHKNMLLSPLYHPHRGQWAKGELHKQVEAVAKGSFKTLVRPSASGYAVHTLRAALWAFYHTDNFEAGALMAVNLGDDADTTGAVYGQLAGAYYGVEAIPAHWLAKLHQKTLLTEFADDLYNLSK